MAATPGAGYNPTPDLARGLVAYYPFDGNANDASGNGHDGTENGAITYVEGVKNQSINFDGNYQNYIRVPHHDDLNIKGNYTFSFWINRGNGSGAQFAISKGRDCLNSYFYAYDSFFLGYGDYGNSWCDRKNAGASFNSGEWHFVTVIVSNTNQPIQYYLDGQLASETAIPQYATTNTYDLVFGRHDTFNDGGGEWTYPYTGKLDEVRIYNRALTSAEINELHAQGNSPEQPVNKVIDLNGNHRHWCAIANNRVTCWGDVYAYKEDELLATFVNPKQVSHGRNHVCVLDDRGVECWGWHYYGVSNVPALSNPTYLSSGEQHVCAIDDTGVVCWGRNDYGQTDVPANLVNPREVSAGGLTTCALDDTGVVCWGWDHIVNLQVDDIADPEQVRLSQTAERVCVSNSNNLSCWGASSPADFPDFTDIAYLGQFDSWGYCVIDNNEVVCWDTSGVYKPSVSNPTVASYTDGTYCVGDDEGVRCWGRDAYGKLEVPEKLIFNNDD